MISAWQLRQTARSLQSGEVIAYPTESVYGLGCDPFNQLALSRILDIKQRPAHKGLIILVSDISQALPFIGPLASPQLQQLGQPQQRATTWLIKCRQSVSPLLRGHFASLAVRITTHPVAKAICEYTDRALVSTSCNIAGKPELTSAVAVRNHMYTKVNRIVGGKCGAQKPSKIIDLTSGRVIRQ